MTVTLEFLGQMLRKLEADMRTLRDDNARMTQELASKASRNELLAVATQITNRFAEFEARMESRFDELAK